MRLAAGYALLLAVTTLAAQNATPSSTSGNANFVVDLSGSACPVSMRASQGSGRGLLAVHDAKSLTASSGASQRIHLTLESPKAANAVEANVIVRGTSNAGRLENAVSTRGAAPDRTRRVEAIFAREGENGVAADLVLPGYTSVSSIRLESITYRDGSTWKVESRNTCQVTPDPMMLVAGR